MKIFGILLLLSTSLFAYDFDTTSAAITKITDSSYQPNQGKVDVLFDDLNPNSQFIQISHIVINGAKDAKDNDVLKRLKYEAWKMGADAVIRTKKGTEDRKFSELFKQQEDQISYKSITMSGIAVRYLDTLERPKGYDTAMMNDVPKSISNYEEKYDTGISQGIILSFGFILVVVSALIYKSAN